MVPLVSDGELYGIFELASFKVFEAYEIEFCTKIAENITQAISRQQINEKTKGLLEQSRHQAEELSAQEEEMRQSLEEMQVTQEEMAKKEAEMTGVLNALNHSTLVVELDLEGHILSVNNQMMALLGLSSKDDIIGKNYRSFYDSNDFENDQLTLWGALKDNKTVSRKSQLTLANADNIWLNETYSPILDEHGNVIRVLNISFDITEEVIKEHQISQQNEEMLAQEEMMRQNMEELMSVQGEIERKEAEMKSVQKALNHSALIYEMNLEGDIVKANPLVINLLGFDSDNDIIGENHKRFYSEASYEEEKAKIWDAILKKEIYTRKAEIKLPNGSTKYLNETYAPVINEQEQVERIISIAFELELM